jgi:hypothetical protein
MVVTQCQHKIICAPGDIQSCLSPTWSRIATFHRQSSARKAEENRDRLIGATLDGRRLKIIFQMKPNNEFPSLRVGPYEHTKEEQHKGSRIRRTSIKS